MTLNANVGLNIGEDVFNSMNVPSQTNRTALVLESESSFDDEDITPSGTLVVHT